MFKSFALRHIVSFACVVSSVALADAAWAQDPPAPAPEPASSGPVQPAQPQDKPKAEEGAKNTLAPNSIFIEGLGAAIGYSINYERMVVDDLGVRMGLSYLSIGATASGGGTTSNASASFLFIPLTADYVGLRAGSSALELGGGVTLLYVSASANGAAVAASGSGVIPFGVATVGYRLQPVDHPGFMFRIGVNALVASGLGLSNPTPGSLGVLPWPYISMGASF